MGDLPSPSHPPAEHPSTEESAAFAVDSILFDLDGTLVDTTDLIFQSYQHAFERVLGLAVSTESLLLGYGQPLIEAFPAILNRYGGGPVDAERRSELIDRLIQTYRAFNVEHHDRLIREFPGVRETLPMLRERGYRLGLVTSKSRGIAERGLQVAGLAALFDTQVFFEDTTRHKPHPDPLLLALDRLGLRAAPHRAMYVGDSTHDLIAGRAAGVRTAAALWGPFPEESLRALGPDYLFGSIEAVLVMGGPDLTPSPPSLTGKGEPDA